MRGEKIDQLRMVRGDDGLTSSFFGGVGKPQEPGLNFRQCKMGFGMIEAKGVFFVHGASDQGVKGNQRPLAVGKFAKAILGDLFGAFSSVLTPKSAHNARDFSPTAFNRKERNPSSTSSSRLLSIQKSELADLVQDVDTRPRSSTCRSGKTSSVSHSLAILSGSI